MKNKQKTCSVVFILAFAMIILMACLSEDPLKMPFQTFVPPNLGDEWVISNPTSENIDGEALKNIYIDVHDDANIWQIRSLLVFRNGRLVAESYMKDANDRINPAAIWSCTKQIVAILTGIAVDQGLISINDPISNHLSQVSSSQFSNKSGITIENLLTMRSGINFSNDGLFGQTTQLFLLQNSSNSIDSILGLSMRSSPGTQFHYNDGDLHILSAIHPKNFNPPKSTWSCQYQCLFLPRRI